MKRISGLFGACLLALSICAAPAPSEAAYNDRPEVMGTKAGSLAISQGAAWSTLTSNEFRSSIAAAALVDGYYFSFCTILNTHATQSIYVAYYAAAGAEPTTDRITVPPGASLPLYIWGVGGYVSSIAIQGSGAATTGLMVCYFHTGT